MEADGLVERQEVAQRRVPAAEVQSHDSGFHCRQADAKESQRGQRNPYCGPNKVELLATSVPAALSPSVIMCSWATGGPTTERTLSHCGGPAPAGSKLSQSRRASAYRCKDRTAWSDWAHGMMPTPGRAHLSDVMVRRHTANSSRNDSGWMTCAGGQERV